MARPKEENGVPKAGVEGNAKKPYETPELVVHGSVEKITEEQKGTGQEDGGTIVNPTRRSV
ncbi:MAG: lasso RiPP family leader peptide-containing protein [Desulfomonilaceae bacterium]|nr:lasso RiPP family leader peptide-containing protein [Desulfomonilaceae bacterium]